MEEKRGTDPGAETLEEGMIEGETGAGVDPGTRSAAAPHTALCHVTERIPETRETAGGEGGTRRRSAGAGPGHRGSWGNSTLGEEKKLKS